MERVEGDHQIELVPKSQTTRVSYSKSEIGPERGTESAPGESDHVRGRIYAEKPKNFRMKVTFSGKDEVDIGSNQNEFWFWVRRNVDKHQYYCSYKDLNEGKVRMMPLPIQPGAPQARMLKIMFGLRALASFISHHS
jgi:hypothetical protein